MFYCQEINDLASHSPTSSIISPMGGYTQLTSGFSQGCLTVSLQATRLWNPPSYQRGQRSMTHFSNPKRRTYCSTSLKKVPDISASSTSHPRMRNTLIHIFRDFLIFSATIGH